MASSKVLHLTDETFDEAVADGVVLVDMWAPWCGPCLMQAPILEKIADGAGETTKIAKLNVDEGGATAARFGIQAIPTLLLLKNGQEIRQFVGVQTQETLVSAIEKALEA